MRRLALCAALALGALAPPAHAWTPEPATYGVGEQKNVAVTMSDGVALRANVFFPTDPKTGQAAQGPFPVLMVQTPYGKDTTGSGSGSSGLPEAAVQAGPLPYMIQRGYIDVVVDVRGTGDSRGSFSLLDPVQQRDGAELVDWAAKLPHSNGRVGLYGPSYMGFNQFMTANAVGRRSPLKALFPIVNGNDPYRDIAFDGGLLDAEFDLTVLPTIFGAIELANPLAENPTDLADLLRVETDHAPALLSYNLDQALDIATDGDQAYDQDYWQARAPRNMLARVVANRIPAFMIGGWYDVLQRGSPLNYSGLQNAFAGRPVTAPMKRRQRATGRYQLLEGPWYHLDAGAGFDVWTVELAWFDRWLKGIRTGIEKTRKPLHMYMVGADKWVDAARWPIAGAKPTTLWFDAGGTLSASAPRDAAGADPIVFTAAASPCSRETSQWSMGVDALVTYITKLPPNPCTQDDRSIQAGPGALTYTTPPFTRPRAVAGPVDATVYATSTTRDVELEATLEDIAPDGTSKPLTSGALLGSFRALERRRSWLAPDSRPLLPYHPYTRASLQPVEPGKVTRFDIEVFPTLAQIASGHRLRVTLRSSDTPHLLARPTQMPNLIGGVYQVQRNAQAASFVELPLADPGAFPKAR
jgi:putative CocE/NonD family hydrolase